MKRISKKIISIMCVMCLALLSTSYGASGSPKLNKTKKTIRVGNSFTLRVKNTSKKVKWSVNNSKVLRIKSTGKYKATFTGVKKGSTTITAKVKGKKLKCKVTVRYKNQTTGRTVYITNTGKKYHALGCRYLHSKTAVSLSWARSNGYTPCSFCMR